MIHWSRQACVVLLALGGFHAVSAGSSSGRFWLDGSYDPTPEPPGLLLSDNEEYWGPVVRTGVTYHYQVPPDQPADDRPNRMGGTGRALLNGNQGLHGTIGEVGLSGGRPLVVIFDFQRACVFSEWNVLSPSGQVAVRLEMRQGEDEPWRQVFDRSREACPEQTFHRIALPERPVGRWVRLTVQGESLTRLREVWAWGAGVADDPTPEQIVPVASGQFPVGVAYPTVTGIAKSSVSDRESFNWVQSLAPEHRSEPAVWAPVPTWESITHRPVLPEPETIQQPIHLQMARNETEGVALVLRNTLVDSPRDLQVVVGDLIGPSGTTDSQAEIRLGVFGVIGDRGFGNNLGPILTADNLPGASLLQQYLLNGAEIAEFPRLRLPPSGGAVLWLSVSMRDAMPGRYRTQVGVLGGEPIPVTVDVLDVTLPTPFAHIKTYSTNRTGQFPFETAGHAERDIAYALDSGINDWGRVSPADQQRIRQMADQRGIRLFSSMGFLAPRSFIDHVYSGRWTRTEDFPDDAAEQIAARVREVVQQARDAGLDYDQWYGSVGDEPGERNIRGVAALCRWIKQADPQVQIYVNPCYWTGFDHGGVADDAVVAAGLADWYDQWVDISMPLVLLLENRPEAWKHFVTPRKVNSYYYVSGHLDRSEDGREIQKYRRMAWDSFGWGFNGWAFYSWYSPRASAWNHFDRNPAGEGLREPSDYQMVYPGPRGVIPTRHSEALREGWEDWRLLHLLRDQGQDAALAELLAEYEGGIAPHTLRDRALRLAAEHARR